MQSKNMMILALILGVVAVVLVNSHVSSLQAKAEPPKVAFLQATVDIPPGVSVADARKQKMFKPLPDIPKSFSQGYPDAITEEGLILWKDHTIEAPIPAGQFLMQHHLEAGSARELRRRVKPGHIVASIAATRDTALGFLLAPGDIVDVYRTVTVSDATVPGGTRAQVDLVVQGVEVFAVGNQILSEDGSVRQRGRGYSSIAVSGPPEDIQKVMAAMNEGKLSLTLPGQER